MKDHFEGIDPEKLHDMTKLGVKNLTELRWKFRRHEDITQILDEQTELLTHNVHLAKQVDALKYRVRRGEIPDYMAAVYMGNIGREARSLHDEIALNGRIIHLLLAARSTGRMVEA